MEITQLRYFQIVAEYQHITRAAEHLNISQPALSAMISRLENELGVQLFDHKGRSIILNENGQLFLQRVNHILLELDDCKHELREMAAQYEKSISIAVTSPQFLQGIHVFMEAHPDYKWNQKFAELTEIKKMLNTGQCVIALTSPGIYGEEYESLLLLQDRFKVAIHKDNPLAVKDTLSFKDLENERFALLHRGVPFRVQTDAIFDEMDFQPRSVLECDRLLRLELVNSKSAITIASQSASFRHLFSDDVVYRDIEGVTQTRDIVFTYRKGRHLSLAYRQFRDFLIDRFNGHEHSFSE